MNVSLSVLPVYYNFKFLHIKFFYFIYIYKFFIFKEPRHPSQIPHWLTLLCPSEHLISPSSSPSQATILYVGGEVDVSYDNFTI